ncbi:MAG: peptidoglycan-binding domain-containing protein [Elainellaceae cyanobacterium]
MTIDIDNIVVSDDLLFQCQEYAAIAQEYYHLSLQPQPNEAEGDRLSAILQMAETDRLLSFIIDETDHILGHELGLIDLTTIRDQQEQLRRSLDGNWVNQVVQGSCDRQAAQVPKASLEQAQARLKQEGLYKGAIDGDYGPITQQAFDSLRQALTHELKLRGLYYGPIDTSSSAALQDMLRQIKTHETVRGTDIETKVDLLSLESWLES